MNSRPPPTLILASGSPRRASVLGLLGLEFHVRAPDVDETVRVGEPPEALAERLARTKATTGAAPGALSLGFDTIVTHRGDILGKPRSPEEATGMIERLAGETHDVFTGIAIAAPGRVESDVERTTVRFRDIEPGDAAAYVATGEPLDKAGAYGIQGLGASLVTGVEGDFFNVMGFPIQPFQRLLERYGWRYNFGILIGNGQVS
ncbi:MAG: nucleoside triphosphate pyrophosphatase [Gemmatimonadota bacterium]